MMKLLLFKAHGDGDYGALCFEQSSETVAECYAQMQAENLNEISGNTRRDEEDEDEEEGADWRLTLVRAIQVRDQQEAKLIQSVVGTVTSEDFCGDSDMVKNTDYHFLIVEDDDATPQPTN